MLYLNLNNSKVFSVSQENGSVSRPKLATAVHPPPKKKPWYKFTPWCDYVTWSCLYVAIVIVFSIFCIWRYIFNLFELCTRCMWATKNPSVIFVNRRLYEGISWPDEPSEAQVICVKWYHFFVKKSIVFYIIYASIRCGYVRVFFILFMVLSCYES